MPLALVADQRAQLVHLYDAVLERWSTPLRQTALAEHAGILTLPDGRLAFVNDLAGELVVVRPAPAMVGPATVERFPVAIPGEHLACSPTGRWVAVSAGAGASAAPTSDQLSLVDLTGAVAPRRIRTRIGEPGIALDDDHLWLRHRKPGAIEVIGLDELLDAGAHVPQVRGSSTRRVGDDGHGDVIDPVTGDLLVATEHGLERFTTTSGTPSPRGVVSWPRTSRGELLGRAWYLRLCASRRLVVATLRSQDQPPTCWHRWENYLWMYHLDTGATSITPIGPGLVFRCATTASALVTTRIHPDGDELVAVGLDSLTLQECIALPPLDGGPRPGREPWDTADRRAVAASCEGELVLVSRGGHGQLHLVDLSAGAAMRTIPAPSPLHDGGHLAFFPTAVCAGAMDRIGR